MAKPGPARAKRQWLGAALALVAMSNLGFASEFGGDFDFRWLSTPDGRHREMRTLSEVWFKDENDGTWTVPAGTDVDGASIPAFLWTFEGSPFVGNYRRASVVHDHFCTLTVATPSQVHWMFYEAMRADGVGWWEALRKYAAVSAYSWFGGGCAVGVSSMTDLESLPPPNTFEMSMELLAFTQRNEVMDLGPAGVREAAEEMKSIARVRKPLIFDALVEFRLSPTEENYNRLQAAMEREDAKAEDVRELSSLARAATGDGVSGGLPGR